jgi:hypothetical protein
MHVAEYEPAASHRFFVEEAVDFTSLLDRFAAASTAGT